MSEMEGFPRRTWEDGTVSVFLHSLPLGRFFFAGFHDDAVAVYFYYADFFVFFDEVPVGNGIIAGVAEQNGTGGSECGKNHASLPYQGLVACEIGVAVFGALDGV